MRFCHMYILLNLKFLQIIWRATYLHEMLFLSFVSLALLILSLFSFWPKVMRVYESFLSNESDKT